MPVNRLLSIALLCSAARIARGDYLFTWEGSSNVFQGAFQVTDAEMQPNQFYYPLSLTNSLSITSPNASFSWGYFPPNNHDSFYVASSSPSYLFNIGMYNGFPTSLGSFLVQANDNMIQEWEVPPGPSTPYIIFSESGSWNITFIPEPSAAALLVLAAAAWLLKRNRLFRP